MTEEEITKRYQVVHAGFWWRLKIGDGGVPYGRFYSKAEAEQIAALLLREFRNGMFVAESAAPAPDDAMDAARYRFLKTLGGQVLFIQIIRNKGADFLDAAVDEDMKDQP